MGGAGRRSRAGQRLLQPVLLVRRRRGRPVPGQRPEGIGKGYLKSARDAYTRIDDAHGRANTLWGLGTLTTSRAARMAASPSSGRPSALPRLGDRTMEAWALHMLASALIRQRRTEEARDAGAHAMAHFHAAGDVAGLTLTLFDLASVAVQGEDLPRAARLRGAAGT